MSTHTPYNRRSWLKTTALTAIGATAIPFQSLASYPADLYRVDPMGMFIPDEVLADISVRLYANENPYGPSPKARQALAEAAHLGNRYPWMQTPELRNMIAKKEGLKASNIMLGAGSTELLAKAGIAYGMAKGSNIVFASPTFMSLPNFAKAAGAKWKTVPLTASYAHDLDAMEAAIDSNTSLVYLCNPNNPTGTITPTNDIRAFCKRISKRVPIFVDEAYNDFHPTPKEAAVSDLIEEGYQIISARTFSKVHGMAGLRMGYIMAPDSMLKKISPFGGRDMTISIATLKAAIASYTDTDFIQSCLKKNRTTLDYVNVELEKKGIQYIPSYTNFMMFPIQMDTDSFRKKMAAKGVGIRGWMMNGKPWCRVSMGTMEEMEKFVDALNSI